MTDDDRKKIEDQIKRYSGKVWSGCVTVQNYRKDVVALLEEVDRLTSDLALAKAAVCCPECHGLSFPCSLCQR